jgi:hypothetical protein
MKFGGRLKAMARKSCLLAKHLVEAGVPFTTMQFGGWAHHAVLLKSLKYTKLDIDPRKEFHTSLGRPVPMVNGGEAIRELFG